MILKTDELTVATEVCLTELELRGCAYSLFLVTTFRKEFRAGKRFAPFATG